MLNERPSFLSGRAHQRHALLRFMGGEVVSTKLCFHLFLPYSPYSFYTLTSAQAHICTAHARTCTCCTHAGFALIPDCFGFCGGSIRLLFKLGAKPVCACLSELLCVCNCDDSSSASGGNSTVSAAIISPLFHRPDSFPCLQSDTSISLLSGSGAGTSALLQLATGRRAPLSFQHSLL